MDLIRQQRKGVELSIQGMLSGELVIQILNAESAGFVLVFSSGRLAYMSVRDSQGRPDISVQFLRGSGKSANGGIFGSLRNALSSSAWRGDLAAVRAGPVVKPGERDVVSVTSKGRLQIWNLHRGGHNSILSEAVNREAIVTAMKENEPELSGVLVESFDILDVAFAPKPANDEGDGTDTGDLGTCLLLLASIAVRDTCHYTLVHVVLKAESIGIGMVHHIRTYTTPINRAATSRPRLYLPKPGLVAFLVFDRAVVFTSMAGPPDSPDSQLLSEYSSSAKNFEDVIDFREDGGFEITGSGMEEPYTVPHSTDDAKSRRHKAKYPAVVLLVKGGGVIRIAATDVHKLAMDNPQVTAKSKLEQAVFYGTLENNPLSFKERVELQFTAEEIGRAALSLSHEIMSSTTPHIPSLPASIEDHLHRRSMALHHLAAHLKGAGVSLDRVTRWKLLWNAEKIAAARSIWKRYDLSIKRKPVGQKRGLINDLVEYIHERYRSEPVADAGELDRARHWFINDVGAIEIAIPWAYEAVRHSYKEGAKDHATVMLLVSEADDFVLGALSAAFEFRELNLGLYGLNSEGLENGILKKGHEGLPGFWTSTYRIALHTMRLIDLARSLAQEYWQKKGGRGLPDQDLVNKIRLENAQLVDLFCRSYTELCRWLLAQEDQKLHVEGEAIMDRDPPPRETAIYSLAQIGQIDQGIELAEKHRVFPTLVKLVTEDMLETTVTLNDMQERGAEQETIYELARRAEWLQKQVDKYYNLYGARFADALYTYYIEKGELYALLRDNDDHQQYLTNFLRSKEQYAKVAWIHEICREKDFGRASKLLLDLGIRRELQLWDKKVELSLGKLSHLAGRKYSEAHGLIPDGGEAELVETRKQLALTQIQDKVFAHVSPSFSAAIDENAELQLALEVFGNQNLVGKDALARLLEENMSRLINHEALTTLDLVDLLTLMGRNSKLEEPGIIDGLEFYMALKALKCGPAEQNEQMLIQRVIWRRCMIRDDWKEINNTDLKDDEQVSDQLRGTALYSTLKACLKNRESNALHKPTFSLLMLRGGLFEKPSEFSPISPVQALGACTEELDERFKGLDAGVRGSILRDMQAENDMLRHYVDKCRLEKWFEGTLDLANRDFVEEVNEETEDGKVMQQVARKLKEMEAQIARAEQRHAVEMLRSKPRFRARPKAGGSVGFSRSFVKY
jgi:nuclear pore complex protein Nup133